MKTKTSRQDKINIVTLGCSKNLVDSEVLLTQLNGNNLIASHESETEDANVVIVNTCGFIDRAKEQSIETILAYAALKESGNIDKLYVTGCLSERYKNELQIEIPEVDAFFGNFELPELLARFNANLKYDLIGERQTTTPIHYAYLKISEGCNRPCSFCAIPLMRGKHISRPIEPLIDEATFLVSRGVKEIILIAQELTYYGIDLYGKRRLDLLLNKLSEIDGLHWIRLHYAYPAGFPTEILPIIRSNSKICNYLDIPLQHISNDILISMRRGITKKKTKELILRIRDEVPGIALRTTMLVGFPGEDESNFEELLEFVEWAKFERLGVFEYSHEEKTHAYNLIDSVKDNIKSERLAKLMHLQEEISYSNNIQLIGKEQTVLIDKVEGDYYVGRTEFDSPEVDNEVHILKKANYSPGDFVNALITHVEAFDLYGEVAD